MKLPVRPAVVLTLTLALAGPALAAGSEPTPTPSPAPTATPADPFDPVLFDGGSSGAPPEFFGEDEPAGVTRSSERVEDAPGLIAVVGEREIAERGYRTLADLLADVPGFYVEPDERREIVFARGVPQSVLVVYDGIPLVFDSGRDDIPFGEELSLANVRRVEVLRGPGTALWGANAFNGIVNVVSADGRDVDGVRAHVEGGAAEDRRVAGGGASAGMRGKSLEWSVSARALRLDGEGRRYLDTPVRYVLLNPVSIPSGARLDGTGQAAGGLFGEATAKIRVKRFELAGRWSELNSHGALSSYSHSLIEAERNEKRHIPSLSVRGGWSRPWSHGSVGAGAFFLQSRHDDRYPLFALASVHRFGGQIDVRSRTTTTGVDARGDATLGRHTFSGGLVAGYSDSRIETDYISPQTGTRTRNAFERDFGNLVTQLYVQDRVLFFDDKVRFTLGASVDDQTDYQPSINPRGGVVVRVAPGWIAKALYGEAIRTPDSYDLVGLSGGAASGRLSAVEGNPDLAPEKVRTAELAGEYRRGSVGYASVALFASRFDDLIEERAAGGEVQPVNAGSRYSAGVETLGRIAPRSWLSLNGAWTFARLAETPDELETDPLAAAPEHVLSLGATYSPRAWVSLYAGERVIARRDPRGDANEDRLGPYAVTDLHLRLAPVRYFSAGLRITNLFDARYYHRNETIPGRNDAVEIPGDRLRGVLTLEGRF